MRPQTIENEVIACLADGHFWTAGELADTIHCDPLDAFNVIRDLSERGFVEKFDDEEPVMYGWTVEPKAVERLRVDAIKVLDDLLAALSHRVVTLPADDDLPEINYHHVKPLGNHADFIDNGREHADDGEFDPDNCPWCKAKEVTS